MLELTLGTLVHFRHFRHFKPIGIYTHRETTVFSSMNILMEAILDLAVPTNDSLLEPRGKKA
jgi:hypothetical protein